MSLVLVRCDCPDCRLRFFRGQFYLWRQGHYVELSNEDVRASIIEKFTQNYYKVKGRHVSDVMEHVRAQTLLSSTIDPPTWIDGDHETFPPHECLATQKSVIHLPSLVSQREPWSIPASPALFTFSACNFDLQLDAPRPDAWLEFLDQLWSDDPQSIDCLQEVFGYLLTPDTRQQKIFLLVGPKRAGKGTIARVVTDIIGRVNLAAPTLAGLSTNFGLWPLIGKSAAIISDARLSGRADQVAIVERLLSVSGEDSLTIDRKNLQPVTCRLPTRFVLLTNEIPKLNDASGAIVSRMIMLRLTRSFYGREDTELTNKLIAEREAILLWAIEGWRRLHERGHFVQPDSSLEALGEMADLSSPVAAFIRDCCNVAPGEVVSVDDLFKAWENWCESQGRKKYVGTVQSFGRDLLAVEPGIKKRRPREGDTRVRTYEGIGLQVGGY